MHLHEAEERPDLGQVDDDDDSRDGLLDLVVVAHALVAHVLDRARDEGAEETDDDVPAPPQGAHAHSPVRPMTPRLIPILIPPMTFCYTSEDKWYVDSLEDADGAAVDELPAALPLPAAEGEEQAHVLLALLRLDTHRRGDGSS